MKLDSRLSGVLHLLIHLMDADAAVPSERLAQAMRTNPVVIRRTLAGLRDNGIVRSEKGHGGGWTIDQDPSRTTLLDVYRALGSPTIFAMGHRSANPACLVEQAVNVALDDAFDAAETVIFERLCTVTLAAVATDFRHRLQAHPGSLPETHHEFRPGACP